MSKSTINYLLFLAMAVDCLLLAASCVLLWLVFPRGYFPARVLWVSIHKWSGFSLGVIVAIHIALHWRWLLAMTRIQARRLNNARQRVLAQLLGLCPILR